MAADDEMLVQITMPEREAETFQQTNPPTQSSWLARSSPPDLPTNLAVERRFCCLSVVLSHVVSISRAFGPISEPPGQTANICNHINDGDSAR